MDNIKNKIKNIDKDAIIVICINIIIFYLVNLFFDLKYEEVDDFIIYNLYSGLDGTFSIYGIYIHPFLCAILSVLFRVVSSINWHTIFLMSMEFICFAIIGYIFIKKHNSSRTSIVIYSILAAVFHTTLLLLLQYTSIATLLMATALYMLLQEFENNKGKYYKVTYLTLFTIGAMLRLQSLLICIPYFLIYAKKNFAKGTPNIQFKKLIKKYGVFLSIAVIVYVSNFLIYQINPIYREYSQYNNLRTTLNDFSYRYYEESKRFYEQDIEYNETDKEIFDKVGWSKNDKYLFWTFNFGDENIYNIENMQKIVDNKDTKYDLNLDLKIVIKSFIDQAINGNSYISILFISVFFINLFNCKGKQQKAINIYIFLATIAIHILFIVLNRYLLRVVMPAYLIGTLFLIDNMKLEGKPEKNRYELILLLIIMVVGFSGTKYSYGYKLKDYTNYQELISYTNEHKENVYLYTVPSLQYRYLAYSVYEMPPKGAFSNLRVMGGWDMYTENYYDFKERYGLEGNFLDVLKDNVYVIDGDVTWSEYKYEDYIRHIIVSLKENYNIDVKCEKVEEFGNLYIYKITEKENIKEEIIENQKTEQPKIESIRIQ